MKIVWNPISELSSLVNPNNNVSGECHVIHNMWHRNQRKNNPFAYLSISTLVIPTVVVIFYHKLCVIPNVNHVLIMQSGLLVFFFLSLSGIFFFLFSLHINPLYYLFWRFLNLNTPLSTHKYRFFKNEISFLKSNFLINVFFKKTLLHLLWHCHFSWWHLISSFVFHLKI